MKIGLVIYFPVGGIYKTAVSGTIHKYVYVQNFDYCYQLGI